MRIYQDQPLKSRSASDVVRSHTVPDDPIDSNNNNGNYTSSSVKLRKKAKRLSPLTDRHSWSEYHLREDVDFSRISEKSGYGKSAEYDESADLL